MKTFTRYAAWNRENKERGNPWVLGNPYINLSIHS